MAHRMSSVAVVIVAAIAAMSVASAQTANPGNTLASLNFGSIIGGPLSAVIKAQAAAAMTTLDFVQNVGFTTTNAGTTPNYMKFDYTGKSATGDSIKNSFQVPLLTLVPIPYLRMESVEIEFNAKINSISTSTASSSTTSTNSFVTGDTAAQTTTTTASVSNRKDSSESSYQREYSMRVYVHCVQADMPEGMMKVLDILMGLIDGTKTTTESSNA